MSAGPAAGPSTTLVTGAGGQTGNSTAIDQAAVTTNAATPVNSILLDQAGVSATSAQATLTAASAGSVPRTVAAVDAVFAAHGSRKGGPFASPNPARRGEWVWPAAIESLWNSANNSQARRPSVEAFDALLAQYGM
jgi:hypothetical protein